MKSIFTDMEKYLFAEGTYHRCYDKLGAHPMQIDGKDGYYFAVWAPDVKRIFVTGSFNDWREDEFELHTADSSGIWEGFVPEAKSGDEYKFLIETHDGRCFYKADPFAFFAQCPPETASRLFDLENFSWHDKGWLKKRAEKNHYENPLNIYEVHAGSFKRHPVKEGQEEGDYFSWDELSSDLIQYVKDMGYTHIELLPIMEHPFGGSWGYQTTGYYAPTARHGDPKAFMCFVDSCHKNGIGVILDWVPGHFCRDAHGLARFNGFALYEGQDHQQWGTYRFNFDKGQVRSFLISNAVFWFEKYHIDGIRVDGVASMLNLNFGTLEEHKKIKNVYGGEEDIHAIDFLRNMNQAVGQNFPGAITIAEDSSTWPLVTMPPAIGGLGFHYKWDLGWMNDTLKYIKTDFPYRSGAHELLTFSMMYQFNENFVLPLSHDEVVHGKCSLIQRMPGDYWRQFAGLRLLYLYQMTHPGAKLNFMGNEIGQFIEWRYYESIEWFLTKYDHHRMHQEFVKALNKLFLKERGFWENNHSWEGFRWLDANNSEQSILSFIRKAKNAKDDLVVLINFRPDVYTEYRIGVPEKGRYKEIFNTDETSFGGSGKRNPFLLETEDVHWQGMEQSVKVTVPPIGGIVLKRYGRARKATPDKG